jgi:hypothetical protein
MEKSSVKLPSGILKSDTTYPKDYSDNTYETFEVWDVRGVGFVIPSLLISKRSRRATTMATTDRYYATSLDGKVYRVGRGPHVLSTTTIYVKKSRLSALQKFLDLRDKGSADANMIRDRISTRRAQGQLYRAAGRSSWTW